MVSLVTERMLLDFGKGGWLNSAKQQSDKVKKFIEKLSWMVEIAIQVNSR
jgi:hypothetical protein